MLSVELFKKLADCMLWNHNNLFIKENVALIEICSPENYYKNKLIKKWFSLVQFSISRNSFLSTETLSLNSIGSSLMSEGRRGIPSYTLAAMFKHATRSWLVRFRVSVATVVGVLERLVRCDTLIGRFPVISATIKLSTMSKQWAFWLANSSSRGRSLSCSKYP